MSFKSRYTDVTVVLLAGGKSSRMGRDKGELPFSGTTFSNRILELAHEISDNVIVSANENNADLYAGKASQVVIDTYPEKGPMGGVISVLPHIKTPWFFLWSVDSPLFSHTLFHRLWREKEGYDGIMFETEGHFHPLLGLYNLSTQYTWEKRFQADQLKITDLVKELNHHMVPLSQNEWNHVININTLMEYNELKERLWK